MLDRRQIAKIVVAVFMASGTGIAAAQEPGASARPAAFRLLEASIDDIHAAFSSGQMTCRRLVELYLERIEAYDKAGPNLNAVQTVNPRALQEAEQLDAAYRSSGPMGALQCIPVLVKDQTCRPPTGRWCSRVSSHREMPPL